MKSIMEELLTNPEKQESYTEEQLIDIREQISNRIEELQAAQKAIGEEIIIRLKKDGLNATRIGQRTVSIAKRVSYGISLGEAKELGAIKEAVDNDALKKLDAAGVEIPGKKVSEYIVVRDIVEKDE